MKTILKLSALAGLTAAVLLLSFDASAEMRKLRIATEGAYPPFNMTNAAGQLEGFDVDIAKALCKVMKADCEIVAQDWDGIIPGLVAKKYDAIIASMSITDERKKTVDFSERYYSNHLRFYAKKHSNFSSLGSLGGKNIGAQRATIAGQWLEDNLGRKVKVKLYDTQTAANADLASGRLDAIISDVYPAYDWLQNNSAYEFVLKKIDIQDNIGVAVRKGDRKLRNSLSKAIKAIRNNGTYAKINAKYFPFDIY